MSSALSLSTEETNISTDEANISTEEVCINISKEAEQKDTILDLRGLYAVFLSVLASFRRVSDCFSTKHYMYTPGDCVLLLIAAALLAGC